MNAQDILNLPDLATEEVVVPEWQGQTFRVKTMTGTERDSFEAAIQGAGGKINLEGIRGKLLVRCLVDDQGARIFQDSQAEALGRKSARALDRLFGVAQRLNGLSKQDVEDLLKNS